MQPIEVFSGPLETVARSAEQEAKGTYFTNKAAFSSGLSNICSINLGCAALCSAGSMDEHRQRFDLLLRQTSLDFRRRDGVFIQLLAFRKEGTRTPGIREASCDFSHVIWS